MFPKMKAFGLVIALSTINSSFSMMTELLKDTQIIAEDLLAQVQEISPGQKLYITDTERRLREINVTACILLSRIRLIQEKLVTASFIATTDTDTDTNNVSPQTDVSPGNRSYADVAQEKADK